MNQSEGNLFRRLLVGYALVMVMGVSALFFSNMVVYEQSWEELWKYNVKGIAVGSLLLLLILDVVTRRRLHVVKRYAAAGGEERLLLREPVVRVLFRFPGFMFRGMAIASFLFSLLFHAVEMLVTGGPQGWASRDWLDLANTFLNEQALGLLLAIFLYSMLRFRLRPYIVDMAFTALPDSISRTSLVRPLLVSFSGCFFVLIVNVYAYTMDGYLYDLPVKPMTVVWLCLFYFTYALLVFTMFMLQMQKELYVLTEGIRSLVGGERDRLHGQIPIATQDEVGLLTSAFNRLQRHTLGAYEELDRELRLAYNVQQSLLPTSIERIGSFEIGAVCRQMQDVGGDFYDIIPLPDGRLAVAIGDVSGKGVPAALLMSATIVLVRAEVRAGGTPADIVGRLNRSLYETLLGNGFVTIGIALIDPIGGCFEYTSAGHVAPFLLGAQGLSELLVESLPLGIDPDYAYSGLTGRLEAAETLVLYTDGVIEVSRERDGDMISFEGLEEALLRIDADRTPAEQAAWLLGALAGRPDAPHEDDRTIVLIKRHPV